MTTTWRLGIDWNRNGVICWDAQPGDALNLFPQPVRMTQLDWRTDVATSVTRIMHETENGLYALQVVTGTGTTNGLIVGQTNAGVAATHDHILNLQVSADEDYRFSVRVRGLSSYSSVNFRLRVKDQAGTTLVTSSAFELTTDWQVQAVALTTDVSTTHLVVEIVKDTNAADVTFQATGFMLVQGTVLPGFNVTNDSPNIFPQPLRYTQLDWRTDTATSVARVMQESDYGMYAFQVTTGPDTTNGLVVGQTNAGVAAARPVDRVLNIQVAASTDYVFSVRVRGLSDYSGVNFLLRIKDQAGTTLVTSTPFELTADWQIEDVAFTTGTGTTYLVIEILKETDATNVIFQATGFMLMQGTRLPSNPVVQVLSGYDNITAHVVNVDWFVGIHKPYQLDADDSRMTIGVSNADRLFSPEYIGSPLYGKLVPLRPVVLQSWDGTTRRTHWTGWIESIAPKTNVYGERTVEIVCAGAMLFFEDAVTQLELQENKRTDELIEMLLDQVLLPTPLTQTALLDQPGYCELDINAFIPDTSIGRLLQVGKTTLAFAADNWVRREVQGEKPDPFNVYRAMKDVVAAERGRFFFSREGQAMFWNRHDSILNVDPEVAFDDAMTDLSYEYASRGDFANHVTVAYHPRSISETSDEPLWQLETPVTLSPDQEREISVSYRDDSQNRIGARAVYLGDYVFSEGTADISLVDIGANRATLQVLNRSLTSQVVLSECVVRGQKITDFGEMEIEKRDGASIAHYGHRKQDLRLQALDDTNEAESIMAFELLRRKDPAGHVQSLTLRSHGLEGGLSHAHQLALTIGNRVTIAETQTGHSAAYFIIGERHRLSASGTLLETTWQLEPAVQGHWLLLDVPGKNLLDGVSALLY